MKTENTVRCNNCMWEGVEDELKTVMDLSDDGISNDINYCSGCPECETDEYLTDL